MYVSFEMLYLQNTAELFKMVKANTRINSTYADNFGEKKNQHRETLILINVINIRLKCTR